MMTLSGKKNRKGFTLAELLIVVAIIGVLVAIAIPVFNKSTEKSREAYDIYTMRQAASAAIELFYAGVEDQESANAAGLRWWNQPTDDQKNAAGVYDPSTGKFLPRRSSEAGISYGKGTKVNGGTDYTMGNARGAYAPNEDYTDAAVMVSIYPLGNNKHIDVYWKYTSGSNIGKYVGGENARDDPKYSIRVQLG